MIRITLIDDHGLVRQGLKALLNAADDMEVVADSPSFQQMPALVPEKFPHIMIVHLHATVNALATVCLCKEQWPTLPMLVIAHSHEQALIKQLFALGILGYLGSQFQVEDILMAVRKVAQGLRYIPMDLAKQFALQHFNRDSASNPFVSLSPREMDCARLWIAGKQTVEISRVMKVMPKTINSYRHRILQKLHVSGQVDLIKLAMRHGLLEETC